MWIFPAFGASTSRRDVSLVRKETPLDWDSESSEEEEAGFLKVGEIRMDQKRVLGKLGMWSGCCFSSWATKKPFQKKVQIDFPSSSDNNFLHPWRLRQFRCRCRALVLLQLPEALDFSKLCQVAKLLVVLFGWKSTSRMRVSGILNLV